METVDVLGIAVPVPSAEQALVAQTYGLWIQTGAIVISAVVAFITILAVRSTARKRATLDLLRQTEYDEEHRELRKRFRELRDVNPKRLVHWADGDHKDSSEQLTILTVCNHYEMIAVGIRENILDEALYKRWFRSQLLKDWEECQAFVMEIRKQTNNKSLFCEFQWLAKQWGASSD